MLFYDDVDGDDDLMLVVDDGRIWRSSIWQPKRWSVETRFSNPLWRQPVEH